MKIRKPRINKLDECRNKAISKYNESTKKRIFIKSYFGSEYINKP